MSRLSIVTLVVIAFFSFNAKAQDMLPLTTVDGFYVVIPSSMASNVFGGHIVRSISRQPNDSMGNIDLTKAQVCADLKSSPPKDENGNTCSVSTYPPAPRIPSASGSKWGGNGCGATPWSTAMASGVLMTYFGGRIFSGDLNAPVKTNPSIDFTSVCNTHDSCYTSHFLGGQGGCDSNFSTSLTNYCSASTDPADCSAFASAYEKAVTTLGAGAYASDQAQLNCAEWGSSMKNNGC